ncbi:amidohydrolase family protein [Streptomyces malaysiensis]|uniref:amidohydrolase family protein n=1 Tax=Streptomyces malaysiensis TaxID=92644 RepID=UPI000BFD9A44|nr:amidohydrolase family protein [Streptomyces malaysiensis]
MITVTGLPVGDAVRMSATTAALLLGLDDRGALTPGHRADLVELDPEFRPVRVFLGGRAVQPT